jgi:hypothetical protein
MNYTCRIKIKFKSKLLLQNTIMTTSLLKIKTLNLKKNQLIEVNNKIETWDWDLFWSQINNFPSDNFTHDPSEADNKELFDDPEATISFDVEQVFGWCQWQNHYRLYLRVNTDHICLYHAFIRRGHFALWYH